MLADNIKDVKRASDKDLFAAGDELKGRIEHLKQFGPRTSGFNEHQRLLTVHQSLIKEYNRRKKKEADRLRSRLAS